MNFTSTHDFWLRKGVLYIVVNLMFALGMRETVIMCNIHMLNHYFLVFYNGFTMVIQWVIIRTHNISSVVDLVYMSLLHVNVMITAQLARVTRHWPNVGLMLEHCLRRWTNIIQTSGQRLVFAWVVPGMICVQLILFDFFMMITYK